jgi:hypothetical protein
MALYLDGLSLAARLRSRADRLLEGFIDSLPSKDIMRTNTYILVGAQMQSAIRG